MSHPEAAVRRPPFSKPTRLPRRGHSGAGTNLPASPANGTRKHFIKVRVNAAERQAIQRIAEAEGGISAFIRRRLSLSGPQQAIREVTRLARNLSLMARQSRGYPAGRAVELIAWLMAAERQLDTAVQNLLRKLP